MSACSWMQVAPATRKIGSNAEKILTISAPRPRSSRLVWLLFWLAPESLDAKWVPVKMHFSSECKHGKKAICQKNLDQNVSKLRLMEEETVNTVDNAVYAHPQLSALASNARSASFLVDSIQELSMGRNERHRPWIYGQVHVFNPSQASRHAYVVHVVFNSSYLVTL